MRGATMSKHIGSIRNTHNLRHGCPKRIGSKITPSPTSRRIWTHPSVVALAEDQDPIARVVEAARDMVMQGMDAGWTGPPYDPFELAEKLHIAVRPANLRVDARTIVDPVSGEVGIEYNPSRPRARIRFSVAHELGHLLFPDVAEQVRHRTTSGAVENWTSGDDWQLEALCNVAAAEILMPSQTLTELGVERAYLDMPHLMDVRSHLQVSAEALLRRVVTLSPSRLTMFAAHRPNDASDEVPRLDYAEHAPVGSATPTIIPPADTCLGEFTAIGQTVSEEEEWGGTRVRIEAVGLPPYPGLRYPRVVGLLVPEAESEPPAPTLVEVEGDVFPLPETGVKQMVLHLVSNGARRWAGAFATKLADELPSAGRQYEEWARGHELPLDLGQAVLLDSLTEPAVCCLVAQEGYGRSAAPRIRYPALAAALEHAAEYAVDLGAHVHAPAIGTGRARGHWPVIRDQIDRSIARRGIPVTIHHLRQRP